MATQFNIRICTPKGVFLEEAVKEATLPSSDGTFGAGDVGVLPDHADYTGLVGTGLLEYVSADSGKAQQVVISNGFMSFQAGTLLILTDSADSSESVDRDLYAHERADLQATLKAEMVESTEWMRAKTSLDRIETIDRLISH